MIRPIYLYGAEVLRKKAAEVNLEDREAIAALVRTSRIHWLLPTAAAWPLPR